MNNIQTAALRSQPARRMILTGLAVLSSIVAITFLVSARSASPVIPAQPLQGAITGEWVADFNRKNPDEVQFTIIRR